MPAKGQYKASCSKDKECKRQRKKNQKPKHKKKRVESNRKRKKLGLKANKGNTGNPAKRREVDHGRGGLSLMSHKKNRSRNNNKNHKGQK